MIVCFFLGRDVWAFIIGFAAIFGIILLLKTHVFASTEATPLKMEAVAMSSPRTPEIEKNKLPTTEISPTIAPLAPAPVQNTTPLVPAPAENIVPIVTVPPPVVADGRALNAEGVRLSRLGNVEQALSVFEQAAQASPNDGEILGNLSYSYYQLGYNSESEQILNRALSLKPKRGASWILMGQLRSVRGDLNGAVDALSKYLFYSSRKNAAVEQLSSWANGYGDGANLPTLRQASVQALANSGY